MSWKAFILIFLLLFPWSEVSMSDTIKEFSSIKDVPESVWRELSRTRIYFGHQSVGYNILDGIRDLMAENPEIELDIRETKNPEQLESAVFAHSEIGENTRPKSKVDGFANVLRGGVGDWADIAFFKFCYLDFQGDMEPAAVFELYRDSVSRLKKSYPNLVFIHLTTPLTSQQKGLKAWIKKVLGRPLRGFDDNVKRQEFNELVRNEFKYPDRVFDLADIESTTPHGEREHFIRAGVKYPSLAEAYTDDGAHLNRFGSKVAAARLLVYLGNVLQQR
jgi:hypothetical protein